MPRKRIRSLPIPYQNTMPQLLRLWLRTHKRTRTTHHQSTTPTNKMTQLDLFNAPPAAFEYPNSEPPQEYQIIYCDPPWDYDGRTFLNGKAHETGSASDHYPTMKPDELCQMNIQHITSKNAICYMWTTGPQLDVSIKVLTSWGFKYKTIAFIWDKIITNPGYYTMSQTELCIVGTKGAIPKPRGTRNEKHLKNASNTTTHRTLLKTSTPRMVCLGTRRNRTRCCGHPQTRKS